MTSFTVTTARKVSKSTFYENQTPYGDIACGFSSQNVELELNMDSDSENEVLFLVGMMKTSSSFQKETPVVVKMM